MRRTTSALIATAALAGALAATAPAVADDPVIAEAVQSYSVQDPTGDTEDREGDPTTKQRQFADITQGSVTADDSTGLVTLKITTVKVPPAKSTLKVVHTATIVTGPSTQDRLFVSWNPKNGKATFFDDATGEKFPCKAAEVGKDRSLTFPFSCLGDTSSAQFNLAAGVSTKDGIGLATDRAPIPNNVQIAEGS